MKKTAAILFSLVALSFTANAQRWTEVEVYGGTSFVQGEMQESAIGFNSLRPTFGAAIHTRANKSNFMSFGGSFNTYSMNTTYMEDKNWLSGHSVEGMAYQAQLSMRLIMTGRDDMRFMKGAFLTYFEAGLGAHFASFRSTYPPDVIVKKTDIDRPTQTVVAPLASGTLGFQYYFNYKMGINFRLTGQAAGTDYLDGIQGITDANDYLMSATLGMTFAL
ncbi:hypothetical protein [Phaeocystidibacter luteus]|uniref:Outer membrane protein beta-barrel domain-containing protein n=1 Tax=Phaeocystidibacter luteus TaxID=911197 RepID=A0A6N6RLR4_9FLAO|nr:hypothetical protein [Phaeocystidibacter luteus]KAB2814510.1 hypothetical protein F8C67_01870 [Phaeocystidibacter luteus]